MIFPSRSDFAAARRDRCSHETLDLAAAGTERLTAAVWDDDPTRCVCLEAANHEGVTEFHATSSEQEKRERKAVAFIINGIVHPAFGALKLLVGARGDERRAFAARERKGITYAAVPARSLPAGRALATQRSLQRPVSLIRCTVSVMACCHWSGNNSCRTADTDMASQSAVSSMVLPSLTSI